MPMVGGRGVWKALSGEGGVGATIVYVLACNGSRSVLGGKMVVCQRILSGGSSVTGRSGRV